MLYEFLAQEMEGQAIRINRSDEQEIGLKSGQLVKLSDPTTGIFAVGVLESLDELSRGYLQIDPTTLESIGSGEEMPVMLEPYEGEPKRIDGVVFGIKPVGAIDDKRVLIMVREYEKQLLRFMDGSVVVPGQMFRWADHQLNLVILETDPPLKSTEIGLITTQALSSFSYRLITDEPPFDGILLIDVSGSMHERDMMVPNISSAIQALSNEIRSARTSGFLGRFRDNEPTTRFEGATLSAVMYLVAKVARGKGEKIAMILFSHKPHVVTFDDQPFYDASTTGDITQVIDRLVEEVTKFGGYTTDMAAALAKGVEIADRLDPQKMKMIVMLTDGHPDKEEPVYSCVKNLIASRKDIVMFAAGIGAKVNDGLMQNIVELCGGEYLKVQDLTHLVEWYRDLARKMTIKGEMG